MLQLKQYPLPHQGIIPGARGHKKITVPAGTEVWCIEHTLTGKIFWCAYLDKQAALKTMQGLEATASGQTRRPLSEDVLVAWNFKVAIPQRIARPRA